MVDVAVAGAHGKVARHLVRLLAGRGDAVRGIIRDEAQGGDVRSDGAVPVVLDLEAATEERLARAIDGADAVVFAAGAGPGSGAARKETVDYGAASKLIAAAGMAGARRYVMVSSIGAGDPPQGGDDVFGAYLRAKARADEELMASELDWTIVRPGRLTDDPPTGRVRLSGRVPRGAIPRADVAAVIAAVLRADGAVHQLFELVGGDEPIEEALDALAG